MESLAQRWIHSGSFFQNQGTFFDFKKRAGEASPLLARLILHSSKQRLDITMMTTKDKFKLIFLYKIGYIFGQTTWLSTFMF